MGPEKSSVLLSGRGSSNYELSVLEITQTLRSTITNSLHRRRCCFGRNPREPSLDSACNDIKKILCTSFGEINIGCAEHFKRQQSKHSRLVVLYAEERKGKLGMVKDPKTGKKRKAPEVL